MIDLHYNNDLLHIIFHSDLVRAHNLQISAREQLAVKPQEAAAEGRAKYLYKNEEVLLDGFTKI